MPLLEAPPVPLALEPPVAPEPEPMVAEYDHPLMFALEVWADSKKLALHIPPFDGPVEPHTVTAPPRERVTIPTPVTLRFAPDGKPQTDSPFEWLILSPP
ncbi:MAG: hypothetical protein DRI90_17825, partial [Deltaproteobacteria bacterium]